MEPDHYQVPQASLGDKANTLARAVISSIPVIGGAGVELFSALITPPLQRRQREWMEEVGEGLRKLEEAGIDIGKLQEDEQFIDIVMQASQAAVRTSLEEKRRALRNAILNVAAASAPFDETMQHVFISMVDEFTVWHLLLLKLYHDPKAWAEKRNHRFPNLYIGSQSAILESAYPELKDKQRFYDQVWKELHARGLVAVDSLHGMISGSSVGVSLTSELGKQFLAFIEREE